MCRDFSELMLVCRNVMLLYIANYSFISYSMLHDEQCGKSDQLFMIEDIISMYIKDFIYLCFVAVF